MQQLSNLDCFYLAKELNGSLAGSFFENFYDYNCGVFRMRFSKKSMLVDLRGYAFEANDGSFPVPPQQPSSFAMLLRKLLSSAKVEAVRQLDFERILEVDFSSKAHGTLFVVIELFGKQGNLILLDSQRNILMPFAKASYAARSIERGAKYIMPPSEKKHALDLVAEDLSGKGKVVSFLSKQTSLAPFYLEEACARAGIPLEKDVSQLDAAEVRKLPPAIKSLFEEFNPGVYLENSKPVAFSSLELKKISGKERTPAPSLSQAVAEYYSSVSFEKTSSRASDLSAQLESQEKLLVSFVEKEGESQKAGKWVFENTALVEELLEAARKRDSEKLAALAEKHGLTLNGEKQFLEISFEG